MKDSIGFIGQGWIGKHYADDFERRGFATVRYALEEPYVRNKSAIKDCRIVFVAVPTPSTPEGFSYEQVRSALQVIPDGATVVVKSTLLPGTTVKLQAEFLKLFVMHSPEFLREANAAHDAGHPDRNIIGLPKQNEEFTHRAERVMEVLPTAPYQCIISAFEAEMVKYAGNCFLYTKVLFTNALYDLVKATGADWNDVRDAMIHDPRIGSSHTEPVHVSGHDKQSSREVRGAGGHCFIKDFEAFRGFVQKEVRDDVLHDMLSKMIDYNNQLLVSSEKDLDILEGVYGREEVEKHRIR